MGPALVYHPHAAVFRAGVDQKFSNLLAPSVTSLENRPQGGTSVEDERIDHVTRRLSICDPLDRDRIGSVVVTISS